VLWLIRKCEQELGCLKFFTFSIVFLISSQLTQAFLDGMLIKRGVHVIRSQWTTGSTGMVLAWFTYSSSKKFIFTAETEKMSMFHLFGVAFLVLVSSKQRPAYVMHVVGALLGSLAAFGIFDFLMGPFWLGCFLFWMSLLTLVSLKISTRFFVPLIDAVHWSEETAYDAKVQPYNLSDLRSYSNYLNMDYP